MKARPAGSGWGAQRPAAACREQAAILGARMAALDWLHLVEDTERGTQTVILWDLTLSSASSLAAAGSWLREAAQSVSRT